MTTEAGRLVWNAVKPLLQTYLIGLVGFIITKSGMFTKEHAKGVSTLTLYCALPALVFTSILPSFNSSNISALGPLFSSAFIYQAIGGIFGLIIREVAYVPLDFRTGIVVACMCSNWANLPLLMIQSVTAQAPFAGQSDVQLGTSYIAVFILSYNIVCSLHITGWQITTARLSSASPEIPHGKAAEKHIPWNEKPLAKALSKFISIVQHPHPKDKQSNPTNRETLIQRRTFVKRGSVDDLVLQDVSPVLERRPTTASQASSGIQAAFTPEVRYTEDSVLPTTQHSQSLSESPQAGKGKWLQLKSILRALATPVNVSILISLPCALINPLRALFLPTPGYNLHAPDGDPPLEFFYHAASVLGSIAVPAGVALLGAGFGRMSIPKPLSRLPWTAMISVMLAKMVILPCIGVLMCQGFVRAGFVGAQELALRFVIMFLSGTPSALNQLVLTQLYSGDHDVDTLCAFLLVQYLFMLVASTALIATSLKLL